MKEIIDHERSKHLPNIEELLGQMTLPEKVAMLAGTKATFALTATSRFPGSAEKGGI